MRVCVWRKRGVVDENVSLVSHKEYPSDLLPSIYISFFSDIYFASLTHTHPVLLSASNLQKSVRRLKMTPNCKKKID